MTPLTARQFVGKRSQIRKGGMAAAQSPFNDVYDLVGQRMSLEADPGDRGGNQDPRRLVDLVSRTSHAWRSPP